MGYDLHTVEVSSSSTARPRLDRLLMLVLNDYAFPASAAACTALGAITAGTGFTTLPALAPSGGTLTAGVSPADPAQAVATSLTCVTATVNAPGTGVAVNDTFTPSDGTLAVAGAYGTGTTTAGAQTKLTATHVQVVSAVVNAAGSSGTPGAVTVTGTTGTGTKWQGTGTISAGGALTGPIVVTVAGDYTAQPTNAGDTITGGSLSGATCTLVTGALTFAITTAGGYTVAPQSGLTADVVGIGVGVTVTWSYGIGTALLTHSGNYSGAPSFTVSGGGGSGASIATATLGGSGAAIPRTVAVDLPTPYNVGVMPNCQAIQNVTNLLKTNVGFTFSLTGATTLAAGTVDVMVIG